LGSKGTFVFGIGITLASLNADGNVFIEMLKLKIKVKESTMYGSDSFKK
jgi:hypothetical protein